MFPPPHPLPPANVVDKEPVVILVAVTVAFKVIVSDAQILTSGPAFTIGAGFIVTNLVAVAFGQPPEPKTV